MVPRGRGRAWTFYFYFLLLLARSAVCGLRAARSVVVSKAMRAVCQRVSRAEVRVDGTTTGRIGAGLAILLGISRADGPDEAERLAGKIARLRIFAGEDGKFDRSLLDTGGAALVVSQFTLIADTRKGNRPSFADAAPPDLAEPLYEQFCAALASVGIDVQRGIFGARMDVELVNDGPVTIVLD
jgi:D-aminoacyl-tRNA deacylase